MADAMATNGMCDLGYQYINIDDFWHQQSARPMADPRSTLSSFRMV
jgi:hypothetical protein